MRRLLTSLSLCTFLALSPLTSAQAQSKTDFSIAWSIYVGWMPWGWAADEGHRPEMGGQIRHRPSRSCRSTTTSRAINQYTAGAFDGCVMTNMDALTIPAVGGVDSTALIVGDFSNGNDGIVSKSAADIAGLKGASVNLVELSVSHYLLARALESAGLAERDLTVVNTSDADLVVRLHVDRRCRACGHLEPAARRGRRLSRCDQAFRQQPDPGRDHRHDGGQYRGP